MWRTGLANSRCSMIILTVLDTKDTAVRRTVKVPVMQLLIVSIISLICMTN